MQVMWRGVTHRGRRLPGRSLRLGRPGAAGAAGGDDAPGRPRPPRCSTDDGTRPPSPGPTGDEVKLCGPEVLHWPLAGPLGGGDAVVLVGGGIGWGVQLVEGLDDEAVGAQHPDPVAMAGVELDPAVRPLQPAQQALRPQELLLGEALILWYAQGGQDTVGQEDQPPTRA